MTYKGRVEKGVVVFEGDVKPRDGAEVRVEEVPEQAPAKQGKSIWEALREIDGTAAGLPPDMAAEHDHYIHGTPKRSKK